MELDTLEFQPGVVTDRVADAELSAVISALPRWQLRDGSPAMLVGAFTFDDFVAALQFANQVGALAERFNHHPEINLAYGKATVTWWTHTAGGITVNDIFMARETDRLV